eukprot:CAMPEP_0170513348 /NCGR_PEP_ID=MMETSP0208-20121228/67353_1 /TAXON_ID=197538 /ORGANISM="Strombidium inclinatum, Strain S3" /LENGTH=44 /DNA_ID= /DNA_START= /DNA_END= /DNA_ORIENTATION=
MDKQSPGENDSHGGKLWGKGSSVSEDDHEATFDLYSVPTLKDEI